MRGFLVAALIGIGALVAASVPASATVISLTSQYDFTGLCSDCTGYGNGVLTVQNYTPGTAFTKSEFVDFTYTSNIFPASSPFEITAANLLSFTGSIASVPSEDNVTIISTGFRAQFLSSSAGGWCLGGGCLSDFGPSHLWTAAVPPTSVPEPMTLAIFGAGLLGAGAVRRRRNGTEA